MSPVPHSLELERVLLTPLTVADAEEMSDVLAAPELYAFIGGCPPTAIELRERYARWARGAPDPGVEWLNWVIRLIREDRAIGTVQATLREDPEGREAELAWIVGAAWQGHGYATEAMRGVVASLRSRGVDRFCAFVHPGNAASAAVARALGMVVGADRRDGEVRYFSASQM